MNTFPPAYRVAQAIGLTGAAWLSGIHISLFSVFPKKLTDMVRV